MATFKFTGGVNKFRDKLIKGMIDNGYDNEFAERTFKQLEGFGSYGFPESHAASFALIAYASSWMKCHHPDVFCCAILNSQPMGFYDPSQLVRDAKQHGVVVRPIDVNASNWDCTLEPLDTECHAVRLGLRMARGLAEKDAQRLAEARKHTPYTSILELARRANMHAGSLVRLAKSDAFRSMGISRRDAAWAIKSLRSDILPLFADADRREQGIQPEIKETPVALPPMTGGREVVEDYRSIGLTLRSHPVSFLREELTRRAISPCKALRTARDGSQISVAGLVLVRQKPGSAKGVMFITLEDETDIANLIVWPSTFDKLRRAILGAQVMTVRGKVQYASGVVHLIVEHLLDETELLNGIGGQNQSFTLPAGRGDEARHPGGPDPRGDVPIKKVRDIYIPDLHIDTLNVKARNFR